LGNGQKNQKNCARRKTFNLQNFFLFSKKKIKGKIFSGNCFMEASLPKEKEIYSLELKRPTSRDLIAYK